MSGGDQCVSPEGVVRNNQSVSSFVHSESTYRSNMEDGTRGGSISSVTEDLGTCSGNSPNSCNGSTGGSGGRKPDAMTLMLLHMKEEQDN